MVVARRPPNMMALSGTPCGDSQSGSMVGHCEAGAVKREFGCAALAPVSLAMAGVHLRPCQSRHSAGGSSVMPSHQTPPSGVSETLVKMVFRESAAIALGFVLAEVPLATPKKPDSGFMARRRPLSSTRIHAISSPTVQTLHPSKPSGGTSMEKFVLPQALGNAAAT